MTKRAADVVAILADHFAHRRDALDVVGRFGNRFEDWVKWEAAVALHVTSFLDEGRGIQSIAVEREACDLFVGGNQWPGAGYPASHKLDVWVELKARATSDVQGQIGLGNEICADLNDLRARKVKLGMGTFMTVALVVAYPSRWKVQDWITELREDPELTTRATPLDARLIYSDSRADAGGDDKVLAGLVAFEL